MTQIAPQEVCNLEQVRKASAADALRNAVDPRQPIINYLASLAYDALATGMFGEGPFDITLTAEGKSFAIVVDGDRS